MTFKQFTKAYASVCWGAVEPKLIQLARADFADLAKLVACDIEQSSASRLLNRDILDILLRQGWMKIYGVIVVVDKNLFHEIGLVRFWMGSRVKLEEVRV